MENYLRQGRMLSLNLKISDKENPVRTFQHATNFTKLSLDVKHKGYTDLNSSQIESKIEV